MERRGFLRSVGLAFVVPGVRWGDVQQDEQLPGRGTVGTLRDPAAVGRPRSPTDPRTNNAAIQRVERRLACGCGCTLDVFTCRTTDFTCTYSPEMHREVLALWTEGKREQEIVDTFVAKYGEKVLMAPKPEGFNLAGYVVPSALIFTAGALLLVVLWRRRAAMAASASGGPHKTMPDPASLTMQTRPPAAPTASADELERLRRALDDIED